MIKKTLLFALAIIVAFTISAFAQQDTPQAVSKEIYKLATGDSKGPYFQMMKNLLDMDPSLFAQGTVKTAGGFDNVLHLMDRKVEGALVQADILPWMARKNKAIETNLPAVMQFHGNIAHIFVLRDGFTVSTGTFGIGAKKEVITNIRQCDGRPVAVFGSGTVTGEIFNERLGMKMNCITVEKKEEGIQMLARGEVVAFIAMGGRPIDWIEEAFVDGTKITLATVHQSDVQAMGNPYYQAQLTYKKLGVVGLNSIAVRNYFVTWNYKTPKKVAQVLKIRDFIRDNLETIKEDLSSHPAWQDVGDLNDITGWPKYEPAFRTGQTQPAYAPQGRQK